VVVAEIGLPPAVLNSVGIDTWENTPALWRTKLPQLQATGNKYSRGHALLYGGYPMTGAARLAARAAARSGAGLTTIAVPEHAFAIYGRVAHEHPSRIRLAEIRTCPGCWRIAATRHF